MDGDNMQFPAKVDHYGYSSLNHGSDSHDSVTYYIERGLSKKKTDIKRINETIEAYKLTFCNHFVDTSHFINFISHHEYAENFKNIFFGNLLLYIKQYYPDFELTKDINDITSLINLFNNCHDKVENIIGIFLEDDNIDTIRQNLQEMNEIHKFYEISEDFMIRFYDYSVVGISSQKHIITSSNQCDKKFMDYLIQGYSLYRLQKVGLVNSNSSLEKHFELLPVLPTKELSFPIDEYIEISDGSNTMKGNRLVKMLR